MGRRRRSLLNSRKRPAGDATAASEDPPVADSSDEPTERTPQPAPESDPAPAADPVPAAPAAEAPEPQAPEPAPEADAGAAPQPPAPLEPVPDAPPATSGPTMVPPDAGTAPNAPADGPLPDFDDVAPPTEEVPNAVLQDISQPYTAPMHVPEPPPIPGILDRFTPAGAAPRGRRVPKIERRPSYIAATPTPAPVLRNLEEREEAARQQAAVPATRNLADEVDDYEAPRGKGPIVLVSLLGTGAFILLLLFVVFGMLFNNQTTDPEIAPVDPVPAKPIQVPDPEPEPEPEPTEDTDAGAIDPEPGVPEPGVPEPGAPEPGVPAPVEPQPTQPSPVTPQPVGPSPQPVRPTPVAPTPTPEPDPVAELGTLRIKSNRRVMVTIGGKAIGYTPRTYKAPAGTISVSAMLPRQPASKQTQKITVQAGGKTNVDFAF